MSDIRPRLTITAIVVWTLLQIPRLIAIPLVQDVLAGRESFSDVIERLLVKRSGSLMSLWGAWENGQDIASVERSVKQTRKLSRVRTRKF